ncbi:MAG: bifunctional serine/threonine-protein kinase/formylglycine-generating enzyme family protein [Pseudomonadota bacterium]
MTVSSPLIPGYKIVKEIGRGGLSTVYLAEQERMFSRQVALKVMSAEMAHQEGFGERFLREARIASQLNHRNIVHIYDTGEADGCFYLAMELLRGGDLTKFSGKTLSGFDAARIAVSVLQALETAAALGVVHRDIKPANIMFREDGTITLVDFGIAFQAEANARYTPSGALVGTPHYMSPEQVAGGAVDERSDIYSVGAVLYETLSGRPPYEGDNAFAIANMHRFDPLPRVAKEHEQFQPIIDKAMAKIPDDRYQRASDFLNALTSLELVPFSGSRLAPTNENLMPNWPPAITEAGELAAAVSSEAEPIESLKLDASEVKHPTGRALRRDQSAAWLVKLGAGLVLSLVTAGLILWFALFKQTPTPPTSGANSNESTIAVPAPRSPEGDGEGDGEADGEGDLETLVQQLVDTVNLLQPTSQAQIEGELLAARASIRKILEQGDGIEEAMLEWKLINTSILQRLSRDPRKVKVGSTPDEIDTAFNECQQVVADCEREWYATETLREVVLNPFRLSATEVSVGDYREFVSETAYRTDAERNGYSYRYIRGAVERVTGLSWRFPYSPSTPALDAFPAVHLSFNDARSYCNWRGGRLPQADEWEYVARGPTGRKFTWGDDWLPGKAPLRTELPLKVDSMDQDAFFTGMKSMTGNVWEWVLLPDGERGLKGGSHRELAPVNLRSAAFREELENLTLSDDGARCAFDSKTWPPAQVPVVY